jgi:hypothetical protein
MSRDNSDRTQNSRVGGRGGQVARPVPQDRTNGNSEPLSFLGRRLPSAFEKRTVTIEPRHLLTYDESEWLDALVIVERGEIELECLDGSPRRFPRGAVLCFAGLPIRRIRNPASNAAVLVAVSRRSP